MSALSPRRYLYWTCWLLLAGIAAVMALRLLSVAAPALQMTVNFSRDEALQAAADFRQQHFPELVAGRQAIAFESDRHLQNYVELEAGGIAALQPLMDNPLAVTHWWRVRLFEGGQEEELTVSYTPGGALAGFHYRQPEQAPGAALDETAALTLAEEGFIRLLGEELAAYQLLDSTQVHQSQGRSDYRFTWQHQDFAVGEARFRVTAWVEGDRLVSLQRLKHIPQGFEQRFGEMRSLSERISQISSALMGLLFGLGGFLLGGIWLIRRDQLQWRPALWPGVFLAAGLAAAILAQLPSAWIYYSTVASANNFLLQQLVQALAVFLLFGVFWIALYAVAEGLGRLAFPHHPGLYHFFKAPQAASPEVLGRVLGAYIWTGFFLLYAVLFTLLTSRWLGWWQPAWLEVNPDILASGRPGLAPLFTALQAGTWEEFLFRAIPLSLAVLIGRRFNLLRPVVIVTLVVQALIFAGAHANYPNLPGYSRLLELFIPALVFGLVFLRYGLMVVVLTHFLYDLVLMSLPLFMADDARLWLDRLLVIAAGLAPLLLVLWARWRLGRWQQLPEAARNHALMSGALAAPMAMQPQVTHRTWQPSRALLGVLVLVGLVGIAFAWWRPLPLQWPEYTVSRSEALERAGQVLQEKGVSLTGEWRANVTARAPESSAYVWQEAGAAEYQQLIGRYLAAPGWNIQWRRFDGPVEERSEAWRVALSSTGELQGIFHELPEGRPGASLDRDAALQLARDLVREAGWGEPSQWQEKAVREVNRPARRDWVIEWLNPDDWQHQEASAWISVTLAGDQLASARRSIDIPDTWHRQQQTQQSERLPFQLATGFFMLVLFGLAVSSFFGKQGGVNFNLRTAVPWLLVSGCGYGVVGLLWLEPTLAHFNVLGSWWSQMGVTLLTGLVSLSFVLAGVFLLVQVIYSWPAPDSGQVRGQVATGIALAIFLAGLTLLGRTLLPSLWPPLSHTGDYPTWMPWLTALLNPWKLLFGCLLALVFAAGLVRFTGVRWKWWLVFSVALAWWVAGGLSQPGFSGWAGYGFSLLKMAVLVALIRRQQMLAAMLLVLVAAALDVCWVAKAAYPFAGLHALLAVVVFLLVIGYLLRHWLSRTASPRSETPGEASRSDHPPASAG